jgi:cytochrome c-type biogenesis protein CcmF
MGAVFLGTLYPLLLDALGLGKISVGPPYFDTVFVPLMTPVVFLMGVGPLARWKEAELPDLAKRLRWAVLVCIVASLLTGWIAGEIKPMATLGFALSWWIVASVATDLWERVAPQGGGLAAVLSKVRLLPRAMMGMLAAHLGVAAFIFGVTMVKTYEVERDVKMNVNDTTEVRGYTFTFKGVSNHTGPNYEAAEGLIEVSRDGKPIVTMRPEKRVYRVQNNPMTEAAISPGLTRDLYVSLGEPVEGDKAWIVRVYVKPFIDWVWGGCMLMALGGILAATDRRYRQTARAAAAARAGLAGAAA